MPPEHTCPWWLAYSFDNVLRRLFHNSQEMLGPYIGPGGWAADVGCGLGYFSLGLARLVGPQGKVFCLDLQEKMLDGVKRRADRAGLNSCMTLRKVEPDNLGAEDLCDRLDLVLGFWMVHEVADADNFFDQVHHMLKPGGIFFMAEPKMHVDGKAFEAEVDLAERKGLEYQEGPKVAFSRAAVFTKVLDYGAGTTL